MSKAQEALSRARKAAHEARNDALTMVSEVGTSYLIGSLEKSGRMSDIPQIMGLPRTVTLAVIAKALEYGGSGKLKQVASGVASSATCIAVYQFSKGQVVSGVGELEGRSRRALMDQAHVRAIGRGRQGGSVSDELTELERDAQRA